MSARLQGWTPSFSKWRHGGWYVNNVRYPSGACGCVSNNYDDGKWRIACDDRRVNLGEPGDFTFKTRDAAARAEKELAEPMHKHQVRRDYLMRTYQSHTQEFADLCALLASTQPNTDEVAA